MKALLAGAAGLCIALSVGTATAQTSHPGGVRIIDRIARQHFDLGNEYFQVARYEDAAQEFQRAYDITHQIELLYNIGRAKEAGGDIAGALRIYEQFEQAGAPGMDRDLLHERMANLRARVGSSSGTPSTANASTTGTTGASASPEPTASSPPPTLTVASVAPSAGPPPNEQRYEHRRGVLSSYGPFVLMGLGVVGGVLAVWQAIAANDDYNHISRLNMSMGMWDASALSSYGNAGTEGTLAWTLGGAGAALLVGGALWLVLRGPGERVPVRTARVLMAPASGGHGAWLGIGGEL